MKIISIKFQNLNSLKGVHEIRFDQAPFNNSNLFAITGPTGAGKTTILDAITVALYGKVHRHDKNTNEIMTRHTAESFSEVEFEIKETTYRARWSLRRSYGKATGELQSPKMELSMAASGKIIISHPLGKVQQSIIDVCGLDYNQFLRSVMLSQGDFTRFLKANESERSELLEKITDTGIYSQISIFVFEKAKSENQRLSDMQLKLDGSQLLTKDAADEFRESLSILRTKGIELTNRKADLSAQLQWLEQITRLSKKKALYQAEKEQLQADKQQSLPLFERLKQHKKAQPFQLLLADVDTNTKVINLLQQRIDNKLQEITKADGVYNAAFLQLTEAREAYEQAERTQAATEPRIIEAEKQDVLIESKHRQLLDIQKTRAAFESSLTLLQDEMQKKEVFLHTLTDELERLNVWLSAHQHEEGLDREIVIVSNDLAKSDELFVRNEKVVSEQHSFSKQEVAEKNLQEEIRQKKDVASQEYIALTNRLQLLNHELTTALEGKTLEDREVEVSGLPGLISLCERFLELLTVVNQCAATTQEYKKQEALFYTQIACETDALDKQHKDYLSAKEHLATLQDLVRSQLLIRKYEDDRKELSDGTPCPLCGSLHHPFADANNDRALTDAEQKRDRQQVLTEKLLDEINVRNTGLHALNHQLANIREQAIKNDETHQNTLKLVDNINQQLPKTLDINKPDVIVAIIKSKKERQALLNHKITVIRDVEKQCRSLENDKVKLNEDIAAYDNMLQQSELKIKHAQVSLSRLELEKAAIEKAQMVVQHNILQIIKPHQIVFSFNERQQIIPVLQQRLERFAASRNALQQKSILMGETKTAYEHIKNSLNDKLASRAVLANDVLICEKELEQLKAARLVLFGDKKPQEERQMLAQTLLKAKNILAQLQETTTGTKQELEIAKSQHTQWCNELYDLQQDGKQLLDKLLPALSTAGINSTDALRMLLMPANEAEDAEKCFRENESQQIAVDRMILETGEELAAEIRKNKTAENSETIAADLMLLNESMTQLHQEMGRIKQIISTDDHNRAANQQLSVAIELQHKVFARWDKLSKLIGSADGKRFSRFAQSITIEQLVILANRHLKRLTDRYLICKNPEQDLELQIVDGYQADITRSMASLSGGESFLVSLALALGLSELASRKTQINSLFIDEGFGMLDAETLDVAVSALENLQATGKTIGIISHMEMLKERIGTQIRVEKQHGGHSKIRIVSSFSDK